MIPALMVILVCQLFGEVVSHSLHLPLPGPVLGMALLLVSMKVSDRLAALVRPVAQVILGNLSLLFVPAGVGIIGHLDLVQAEGLPLALALIGSTVAAIAVGALTFRAVARAMEGRDA